VCTSDKKLVREEAAEEFGQPVEEDSLANVKVFVLHHARVGRRIEYPVRGLGCSDEGRSVGVHDDDLIKVVCAYARGEQTSDAGETVVSMCVQLRQASTRLTCHRR
jgi:hypothetical protein